MIPLVSTIIAAGGARTSTEQYANFLRELLKGTYILKDSLGKDAVCTQPSKCPTAAVYSPVPVPWTYSFHHWVEVDEKGHIEAFSSPGAFGYYPWISENKKQYGIVAREKRTARAGYQSALCGREIRNAFNKYL